VKVLLELIVFRDGWVGGLVRSKVGVQVLKLRVEAGRAGRTRVN
jgi:hypothetical protein